MCHLNDKCDGYHTRGCPRAIMEMVGREDNPDFRCAFHGSGPDIPDVLPICLEVNCDSCFDLECPHNKYEVNDNE